MITRTSQKSLRSHLSRSAIAAIVLAAPSILHAATLDTVAWTADASADGFGAGVVSGGTNGVAYTTVSVATGGTTIAENWTTSLATDGVASGGVTNEIGGIFATEKGSPGIQSPGADVSFEFDVNNPILMVNHVDSTGTMDFTGDSVTLLDSHNAQLNNGIMTFTGATGSSDDGFALQFNGTFSTFPRMDFLFGTSAATDTAAFTVGLAPAPEPATALTGTAFAAFSLMRRKRRPARPM